MQAFWSLNGELSISVDIENLSQLLLTASTTSLRFVKRYLK